MIRATQQHLVRNAFYAMAQVVLSAAALLISYWLLMRALPIEQIGLWSLVLGSTALARLSELGLGSSVLRYVAGDLGAGDPARAARTVGMATVVVTLLVGSLALIVHPLLLRYLLSVAPSPLDPAVRSLLPGALGGVVLGSAAQVFLSALDGGQRMDWRASLQIGGNILQLGAIWLILPRSGLTGLALVPIVQAGFLLLGAIAGTAWLLHRPLKDYLQFERDRLQGMLGYGGGLQLSAMAQMLFEPLLKILLTHWSGLALTGYFDMASRIIQQFRAIVVAAYGVLVPHIAANSGMEADDLTPIRMLYRRSSALLLGLLLPYWACVAAILPLALTLWKGQFDAVFLAVALLQFTAWGFNLLNTPAYMLYIGLGRLHWTILSHSLIGLIVLIVGPLLGRLAGGSGVLITGAAALVIGSMLVLERFHHEFAVGWCKLGTAQTLPALALLLFATVANLGLVLLCQSPSALTLLVLPAVIGPLAALLLWRSPARMELLACWPRQNQTVMDK